MFPLFSPFFELARNKLEELWIGGKSEEIRK